VSPGWRAILVGLAFAAALVPLSAAPKLSGNVWSRYMTIESIVERGTLAIGRSPLLRPSGTPDLAKVGGRLYSDKPPVLPALGAIVYAPLYHGAGLRFAASAQQFALLNWILVAVLVGGGSAMAVAAMRRLIGTTSMRPWAADLLTLALAAGSPLLTYGVTFNNHSVAAGLITASLALVALEAPGGRPARRRAFAGLLAGAAATIDLPAGGAMLVALGLWLAIRQRRPPLAFLAGALGPLAVHAALQSLVTGTPMPVEMYPEAIEYPGSYWAGEAGRFRETVPRWRFALEMLVGPQGWLTVTPALAVGLTGLATVGASRRHPLRGAARVVGAVLVVLVAYYAFGTRRTDFAGRSFGVRHLLPLVPAVLAFAVVGLDRWKRRWPWGIFALLWAVGAVYAYEGSKDPWSRAEQRPEASLRALGRLAIYPYSSYRR